MDYHQNQAPQPFQAQEKDLVYYYRYRLSSQAPSEAKETFIPWIAQPQKVSDNPLWANKKIRFYLSSKEKTEIIQETFVFPVVDYGSVDGVTEDEVVRSVTEEFRQFKEVSHIYYTKYLDGLQFAILLSSRIYDDQLTENLLNAERKLRKEIKDKQIVSFDIDYLFNAKAFNLKALGKETQLIYG